MERRVQPARRAKAIRQEEDIVEIPQKQKRARGRRNQVDAGAMVQPLISHQARQALSEVLMQPQPKKLSQVEQRLMATRLLNDRTLGLNYCDFEFAHHFVPLKKGSASATSMVFASVPVGHSNNTDVAMKVFYKTGGKLLEEDNSLPIEIVNYRLIANSLITEMWSPHVLAYVGSFDCYTDRALKALGHDVEENVLKDLSKPIKELRKELDEAKEKLEEKEELLNEASNESDREYAQERVDHYENVIRDIEREMDETSEMTLRFLITEKAVNAISLEEWLDQEHTVEEMKSVLFQLLYTIECFNRIGFRHNDSHAGNILVENRSNEKNMSAKSLYNLDGAQYCVQTKNNLVKFFDFDRSSFNCEEPLTIHKKYKWLVEEYRKQTQGDCENTLLNNRGLCEDYGQCNAINKKYDAYLTMAYIRLILRDQLEGAGKKRWKTITKILSWLDQQTQNVDPYTAYVNELEDELKDDDENDELEDDEGEQQDMDFDVEESDDDYRRKTDARHIRGLYVPTDEQMPSVEAMLKSQFFAEFRCDPDEYQNIEQDQMYTIPLKPEGEIYLEAVDKIRYEDGGPTLMDLSDTDEDAQEPEEPPKKSFWSLF